MTVTELIAKLQTYPPDMVVIYSFCSDYEFLEAEELTIVKACVDENHGWVQRGRPDKPTVEYLLFPGN